VRRRLCNSFLISTFYVKRDLYKSKETKMIRMRSNEGNAPLFGSLPVMSEQTYRNKKRPIKVKRDRYDSNEIKRGLCTFFCHCNTLHNTLQHTTIHCNTLYNTLQHTTLQHTTIHCNTLQHTTTHYNTLQLTTQHSATHYNTLQHTTRLISFE